VLAGEQAPAEGKAAARALADRELEAARARITNAEDALRATQELADHPGRALYSPETCAENVVQMVRIWDTLQPMEQQLVRNTISMYAMLTGLYDDIKAKGGAEREAELEGQRPRGVPARARARAWQAWLGGNRGGHQGQASAATATRRHPPVAGSGSPQGSPDRR
jgi:hypothetical protein